MATVALNRPKMLNAMSYPLMQELKVAFDYLGVSFKWYLGHLEFLDLLLKYPILHVFGVR